MPDWVLEIPSFVSLELRGSDLALLAYSVTAPSTWSKNLCQDLRYLSCCKVTLLLWLAGLAGLLRPYVLADRCQSHLTASPGF